MHKHTNSSYGYKEMIGEVPNGLSRYDGLVDKREVGVDWKGRERQKESLHSW